MEKIERIFPEGTRIELVSMDDPQAPALGTRGTVHGIDDMGHILVRWDSGPSLNAILGVDEIRKVCPKCGCGYDGYPAISRDDGETEICPMCGMREALEAWKN